MRTKNILVATDGSAGARKAVRYAASLAKQLGAAVTVLQVVDVTAFAAPGVTPVMGAARIAVDVQDILRRAADRNVGQAAAMLRRSGIGTDTAVRSGIPAEEIVKEARRRKTGLVIVGSQGRSALAAAVLGSVAYGVINRSRSIPVLVVR